MFQEMTNGWVVVQTSTENFHISGLLIESFFDCGSITVKLHDAIAIRSSSIVPDKVPIIVIGNCLIVAIQSKSCRRSLESRVERLSEERIKESEENEKN